MSTFMAKILLTVSIKVSPFEIEDPEDEKLTTSADNLFWASSKESLVLVLFSKNKFAIVTSLSEGTFFIFLLITSLKLSDVLKIKFKSSLFKYFIFI